MTTATPAPTGRYAVGRTVREWTDEARADPYAPDPSARRSLVTWIWYPRSGSEPAAAAAYLPAAWQPNAAMLGLQTDGLDSHSVDGAPVADDRPGYPVVLLSPSAFPPLLLSATAEELASHGFVVVGVNHTYETAVTVFADGRVAPMNPAATAGAPGPPTGDHRDVFARRAEVCRYKAADLAFLADSLAGLGADDPLAGRSPRRSRGHNSSKGANRATLDDCCNKVEDSGGSHPQNLPPCCSQADPVATTRAGRSENRQPKRSGDRRPPGPPNRRCRRSVPWRLNGSPRGRGAAQ
jgi:hypothetical protein